MKHLLLFLALLTSCGVYNSSFDCPPGKGVGCAPVGEVLDLIVEREQGEDLFVKNKGTALLLKQQEENDPRNTSTKEKKFYLIKDEKNHLHIAHVPKESSK